MNHTSANSSRLRLAIRAILPALTAIGISSCSTTNKSDGGYTEYTGRPAKYPSDGTYHPYKPGEARPTQYQEYSAAGGKPSGYEAQPTKKTTGTKSKDSTAAKKKKPSDSDAADSTASPAKKKKAGADDDAATAKPSPKKKTTTSASTGGGKTIIAKPGDTFYSLAKKYHTTVDAIKKANNKTGDIVRDGEKLKIP